jgi:hypothetical protein
VTRKLHPLDSRPDTRNYRTPCGTNGEGVELVVRVVESEARPDRAGDRGAVARQDLPLDLPLLALGDVQELLDVGVRAEAAVPRADLGIHRQASSWCLYT